MKKRKVAVFDIDGTIFRSSLLIEATEALVNEGVFPAEARSIYVRSYHNWLNREGDYEDFISRVVIAFEKYIKGIKNKDYLRIMKKVAAFHRGRIYRYTRDLVSELKRKNYYLLAISKSNREAVELFAREFGFDKVYGHIYEIDSSGFFSGKVLNPELMGNKAKVLKRAIEKENLTLRDSVGVGDTESDISFLKMVNRPIAFNPNRKLYEYAKRFEWKIIVERKDVIYNF